MSIPDEDLYSEILALQALVLVNLSTIVTIGQQTGFFPDRKAALAEVLDAAHDAMQQVSVEVEGMSQDIGAQLHAKAGARIDDLLSSIE